MSAQTVQKVEVIKSDDQINKLFNEIGNNELKVDLLDLIDTKDQQMREL